MQQAVVRFEADIAAAQTVFEKMMHAVVKKLRSAHLFTKRQTFPVPKD